MRGSTAGLYRFDIHARHPVSALQEPARVVDGLAPVEWLMIEGCPCGGFGAWADLVSARRLKYLHPVERGRLQARVRNLRALNQAAWLVTADGQLDGPLVVLAERTDRPSRPTTQP